MGYHKATIEFPDNYKDEAVKKFLVDYYETSNTPDAHHDTTNTFTEDGVCVFGSHRAVGRAETHEQRKKLYNEIPGREHRAHRIFPFQAAGEENEQEFMVYGSVTYNHHDGNTKDQEWAARGVVVKGRGDEVELKFYHVFIDTANSK